MKRICLAYISPIHLFVGRILAVDVVVVGGDADGVVVGVGDCGDGLGWNIHHFEAIRVTALSVGCGRKKKKTQILWLVVALITGNYFP